MTDKYINKRLDGRYEIEEVIGVGGMAVVYRAYDSIEDRTVAVKILKDEFLANEEFKRRFKNESKAIAMLNHPNVVKVFDVSLGDVLQYIVMEYIDGITLKEHIEEQGFLNFEDAVYYTIQILKALTHAHEKGIVHRDIKPQNIMLLHDNKIKVTDFGIARFSTNEQRTVTDKAIGSVHYISPEQVRGDYTDEKADIYSVGVMLYEMLTGQLPFEADSAVSVAIMQLQTQARPPRQIVSSIPEGLEQITMHAMEKDSRCRYRSTLEMLSDLNAFSSDEAALFTFETVSFEKQDFTKTKYIPTVPLTPTKSKADYTEDADDDYEKAAPIVPVLAGISAAFIVVLLIGVYIAFKFLTATPTGTESCPKFITLNYKDVHSVNPLYTNITLKAVNDNDNDAGIVFAQVPSPGTKIKYSTPITLTYSIGPATQILKNYSGQDFQTAEAALDKLGISYSETHSYNDIVATNVVVSTNPPANSSITSDIIVDLVISQGPKPKLTTMPDLSRLTQDNVKTVLENCQLTLGNVKTVDSLLPAGQVVDQSPAAGSSVAEQSAVTISISSGNPPMNDIKIDQAIATNLYGQNVVVTATAMDNSGNVTQLLFTSDPIDLSQTTDINIEFKTLLPEGTYIMINLNGSKYAEYQLINGGADKQFIEQYQLPDYFYNANNNNSSIGILNK